MKHLSEVLISQINIFQICELLPNILSHAVTAFHLSESSSSYHAVYHVTPDLPKDSAASLLTCLWAALLTLQSVGNSLPRHNISVFFRWGITDHHLLFLVQGILAKIPWVYFQWKCLETHFFAGSYEWLFSKTRWFFLLFVEVSHLT